MTNYERVKLWRKKNPEKRLAQQRRYNKKHPETSIKAGAKWRKAHYSVIRAKKQRRRARKYKSGGSYTAQQWSDLKLFCGNRCLCCHRRERDLLRAGMRLVPDHVISLSKGGSNDITNIQPLCHGKGGCNNKKGIKAVNYRTSRVLSLLRKASLERRTKKY